MKAYAKLILGVLLVCIIVIGTKIIFFPVNVADKVIDTANGVVDKTLNANNAIINYEQYKDLYNGAKSQVQNIKNSEKGIADLKNLYGESPTWSKDVRQDYSHLKENIDGYSMQYQSLAKEYNSNSSKVNRNLFKDKSLPIELPLDYNLLK